jgi:ABC-2 type transport system permease protein
MDVVRQPWLLLVMVAGPFLVLAGFGLGYSDDIRPYRAVFVGDPQGPVAQRLDEASAQLETFIDYQGIEPDEPAAHRQLERGDIDAYVVLPDDPLGTVLAGERAQLRVVHTRLDPIEQTAIRFASRIAVAEINATILADIVGRGQDAAGPVTAMAADATGLVDELLAAVDAGDAARADAAAARVEDAVATIDSVAQAVHNLAAEAGESSEALAEQAEALRELSARARTLVADIRAGLASGPVTDVREQAAALRTTLAEVTPLAEQMVSVPPEVLVRPFESEVDLAGDTTRSMSDYYAPAAVVLLLQQFGVAFGALTFVRERQQGILDLYQISPVGAFQTLAGKYGAYLALGGVVAAVLVGLVVGVSGVPFAGSPADAAVAVATVLLGSIGLGFLISLWSRTDTQAVLLSMIVLLASLFFTGLFLAIEGLRWPARAVAYVLPATYGAEMLRDVMLRGEPLPPAVLAGACALAGVLGVAAFAATRRRLAVR